MANAFITRRAGTLVKNIANAEVTLDFSSVTYDGSQHAPKIQSVTMNGEPLTNLLHYYATITPQTDAGDYYVIVHGLGEYGGVKQVPWSIGKAKGSVSLEPDSITIQGELGTTGQVIITYEGDGELTISESGIVSAQILEYDPVLENNSWETIAQVAAAGMASKAWNLGDKKAFTIGNETYHAQIIGFDHDDLDATDTMYGTDYNGGSGKAAITFCMEELYTTNYIMNSNNNSSMNWSACNVRISAMPAIKAQMNLDLTDNIRTVVKQFAKQEATTEILTSADDLFIMSEIELYGELINSNAGEGTQYAYYTAGNNKIKSKLDGSKPRFWTRSRPSSKSSTFICAITETSTSTANMYNKTIALAACFCI